MESTDTLPIPNESPSSIAGGHHDHDATGRLSPHQPPNERDQRHVTAYGFRGTATQTPTSATDATTSGLPRREDDVALRLLVSECGRIVADALKNSVTELRKDDETRISLFVRIELPRGSDSH